MAATVLIQSHHGGSSGSPADGTDVTSATIKFRRSDADTNDTGNPIPKPAAGTVYSWRKSFRCKVTVAPDGDISNLRFFSDAGSWGTGVTMYAHKKPTANYDVASSADESSQITDDGGSTVSDASTFTSGSPLVVNSGTVLSATTGYGTQDIVEMQLAVASSASRGIKPSSGSRVFTYRFDET